MGVGVGLVLVAIGAILRFAVSHQLNGVNVHTVGVILMIVGAIGVLVDLLLFMPRRRRVVTRDEGYAGDPRARRGVTTVEDERY
jgi:hypothetical protein